MDGSLFFNSVRQQTNMIREQHPPAKRRKMNFTEEDDNHKKVCKKCVANRSSLKYAGPYVLGPTLGNPPVRSITQCLARKMGTDKFFTLKLLVIRDNPKSNQDVKHGKMLIHTEYSLLSLLQDQDGVVHTHGLFQDEVEEPQNNIQNGTNLPINITPKMDLQRNNCSSFQRKTKRLKRFCLVLDCLSAHDYGPVTQDLVNLQHYVIKEKKLNEREALTIFLDIVRVVNDLHSVSI